MIFSYNKPLIMGILNITPDSFFDGGKYLSENNIIDRISSMINEGADIIDVGGYSSRPNATYVSEKEELKRLVHPLEIIREYFPEIIISLDTFRSNVLKSCLKYINIVNDISSGQIDENIITITADNNLPYISTHMIGTPQTMNNFINYENVTADIIYFFSKKIKEFYNKGIKDIIIDPGFGFSKTLEQNYELLYNLDKLKVLDLPILVGISRKSMIFKKLNTTPENSLNGTTIINTLVITKGANILRVHDVKYAKEIVSLICN